MKLLQEKLAKYDAPQRAMAMGIYPYFREIQSDQDTEVLISGKKVLMFGSNAYLGLTNHPKVKVWYRLCRLTFLKRNVGLTPPVGKTFSRICW